MVAFTSCSSGLLRRTTRAVVVPEPSTTVPRSKGWPLILSAIAPSCAGFADRIEEEEPALSFYTRFSRGCMRG